MPNRRLRRRLLILLLLMLLLLLFSANWTLFANAASAATAPAADRLKVDAHLTQQ